ncbi:MAG: hypothetical protein ABIO68_05060, partial [Sphingomicrobium sp.]
RPMVGAPDAEHAAFLAQFVVIIGVGGEHHRAMVLGANRGVADDIGKALGLVACKGGTYSRDAGEKREILTLYPL